MMELDHTTIELYGTNLIEASAGTGKTYAIACLYLRLLVEKELTPEQILVVTYTEAATKELRGRIRSRIREAIGVIDGTATEDDFLTRLCNGTSRPQIARSKLDAALASFDTASIFTIHGFCLRALQDNAFESGSLYDTELVTDAGALLQEVVDDFWRKRFFAEPAPLLMYALRKKYSPESLLKFLSGLLTNPKLRIIPQFSVADIEACESGCRTLFEEIRDYWTASRQEIITIITTDKGLRQSADTYRKDLLPALFDGMTIYVAGENPFDIFEGFEKFSSSFIEKQKNKSAAPHHHFFDRCEALLALVEKRFLALKGELVEFGKLQLPLRKQRANVRFFDDLLNDLYRALADENDNSSAFAASLRNRYRAALIDEFQDTDPVQYDIFRKIYGGTPQPLFLIGDPKQAIYSFRGADIFAYMAAADEVEQGRRFTLTGNWRSTARLLTAFNTVFDGTSRPFVYDQIAYHPVTSGRNDSGKQLHFSNGDSAPLQVWYMPAELGEAIKVSTANELIPPVVAAEIARLLQEGIAGRALIGERPLVAGDMAVIVRSHRQAAYIQGALREAGIPSVTRSDMSIFETEEAAEVYTLLCALAEPASGQNIRAALVTAILGRTGTDIEALREDEAAWESYLESFRGYHLLWSERGFMVMTGSLLATEGIRGRLLRHPDGERRLTNLLHCFELIHQREHQQGCGIEGLLNWFGERLQAGDAAEEYQLRLETDELAVKIVTVHGSKGLEYPVVFCPFLWSGIRADDEVLTFHQGAEMVKDFGSSDFELNKIPAQREGLAESLRLLYVALTRAKYRCYLCAGKIKDGGGKNRPETSPLSYLFHTTSEDREAADVVSSMAVEIGARSAHAMVEQLEALQLRGGGTIAVRQLPEASAPISYSPSVESDTNLSARTFGGTVSSDWRVASFTSFTDHAATVHELPDRDESGNGSPPTASAEQPAGRSIFSFPRGAAAGIFMHELFENLDFSAATPAAVNELVEKSLLKHGYEPHWQPHICEMVSSVISTPLASVDGSFTLAGIQPGKWLPELEFFLPLSLITSELLSDFLGKWSGSYQSVDLETICSALRFKPVRGMVRGFIDMVFEQQGRYYLLDWKSNHLGNRVEDYGPQAVKAVMERSLYPLQYLLYTVALNRYLSLRVRQYDYQTHFGGVIYIFLRGVTPRHGEEYGFFRDRPPVEMIEQLTATLLLSGGSGI